MTTSNTLIQNIINKTAGTIVHADEWNIIFKFLVDNQDLMQKDMDDVKELAESLTTSVEATIAQKVETYLTENPINTAADSAKLGGVLAADYFKTADFTNKLNTYGLQSKVTSTTACAAAIDASGLYVNTNIPVNYMYKTVVTSSTDFSAIPANTIIVKI